MDGLDLNRFLPHRPAVIARRIRNEFTGTYGQESGPSVPERRVLAHLAATGDISGRAIHLRVNRGLIRKKTAPQTAVCRNRR